LTKTFFQTLVWSYKRTKDFNSLCANTFPRQKLSMTGSRNSIEREEQLIRANRSLSKERKSDVRALSPSPEEAAGRDAIRRRRKIIIIALDYSRETLIQSLEGRGNYSAFARRKTIRLISERRGAIWESAQIAQKGGRTRIWANLLAPERRLKIEKGRRKRIMAPLSCERTSVQ
jgi:hypothetical protein